MVQQVLEAPEAVEPVEQEDAPAEQEAEATPDVTFDESPDPEAADAPEPDSGPDLAQELQSLRQELAELKQQRETPPQRSESEIRAEIEETTRRQAQAEQEQRLREQEWREELNESVLAVMLTKGYRDEDGRPPNPEDVRTVAERFINKRYDQIANKEVGLVRDALVWIREQAEGQPHSVNLSPKAAQYASGLADSFNTIYGRLKTQLIDSGEYVSKAEFDQKVKEAVAADRQARAAKARENNEPLNRPSGAPADPIDRSLEAVTNRIISNTADDKDRELWTERFGRK